MSNKTYKLFLLIFLTLTQVALIAQTNPHELIIPPTTGTTYLNAQIAADTTATGGRVDPDRIYVLKRNGVYFVNTPIRNAGWVLRIKAEEGTGRRPVIFAVKNTTSGANPGQIINLAGSIQLKDLMFNGILEADTSSFALMQGALIATNAAGFDIEVDNCVFSNSNGNHFRTDQAARVIKIKNSRFVNMGYLGRSNLGAGKAIDVRAGSCDTLLLVNNTFVNGQDRIIRHFQSTAAINNLIFDHNTVVNNMSYHGLLSLGIVGNKVSITNNLFYDAFALGNDTDAVRQAEFNESGETDGFGGKRMTWIFTINNATTNWAVSNNYYVVSQAGENFYNNHSASGVSGEGSPLTWHINSRLGADSTKAFKKIFLDLTNIPNLMVNMMEWYRLPAASGGAGKTKTTTNFRRLLHDYDRRSIVYFDDTLKCDYSTSSVAYSGSVGGFPVGDLNWFPTKKSAWEIWAATDVNENNIIPAGFELKQNYPNPFNPTTMISFNLAKKSNVKLSVYDILGNEVKNLISAEYSSGSHSVEFNATGITSGVYFYRLTTPEYTATKKLMILK